MKCCVSTDVGTLTNWLTFEPDQDYSPDTGTGLLSLISYALLRGIILRRENPTYTYWRPVAAARRGFKMALFTAASEHLCRRYMRSAEPACLSSSFTIPVLWHVWNLTRRRWQEKGRYIKSLRLTITLYFASHIPRSPHWTAFHKICFRGISPGRNHIFQSLILIGWRFSIVRER